MKMYRSLYTILLLAVSLLLGSCNKYLDVTPDMRTELNSTDKVAQLLISAYPKADYMGFAEMASDNMEDKGPSLDYNTTSAGPSWEKAFFWEDVVNGGSTNGTAENYWNNCYLSIAAANTALQYINEHEDDQELQPYKGEALLARAYAHFMLVSFFARTYDPEGDNSSPGVPYVTRPENVVNGHYERETVELTFQKIAADLEEGLPLLKNSVYKVPKYHFTKEAAHAFAARFYLFKGDYDKVIEHAGAVYASDALFKANLRPWNTTYAGLVSAQFEVMFTQSSQNASMLIGEANSVWARNWYIRYGMGQKFMANVIDRTNVTGGQFAYRNFNREPFYSMQKWNELFFESKIGSGFGQPYIMIPLLTVDEMLMNRAEAYVQKGQFEMALNDLNTFASTRINNYNPNTHLLTLDKIKAFYHIDDPKEGLIKTILDFKQAEFVTEGLRWFDLNRHKLTIRHLILDENRNESYQELGPDDPRRVFQLPEAVTISGLERNPR